MEGSILITGGTGYIGSHTSLKLLNAGYEIIILDNLSNSCLEVKDRIKKLANKGFQFINGDIRNTNQLKSIFKDKKINAVIHFAGLKAVADSAIYPLEYYENNVVGSLNLFKEMASANIKSLVFSSSATVYGNPRNPICKENTPLNPVNVYGKTKLIIEDILRNIKIADPEWRIINLRYFNPVGAHPSGMIGEDPKGTPNNLMPLISQIAIGRRKKLLVFGDNYNTPDGTGRRDYIHIEDVANAHVASLEKILKGDVLHMDINLGTGKPYSVLEVIKTFESVSLKKIPYEITKRRAGDLAEYYADPSLAKNILNWKAKFDLRKMCLDSWNWQSKNPSGFIN